MPLDHRAGAAVEAAAPVAQVRAAADASEKIDLPLRVGAERILQPLVGQIADIALQPGEENIDHAALFEQVVVDKPRLARHIQSQLQGKPQITLRELVAAQPLQHGLAELVAYLQLGSDKFKTVVDEAANETIDWPALTSDGTPVRKSARLPRVIFLR